MPCTPDGPAIMPAATWSRPCPIPTARTSPAATAHTHAIRPQDRLGRVPHQLKPICDHHLGSDSPDQPEMALNRNEYVHCQTAVARCSVNSPAGILA
jgi:hypothetical protein